MTHFFGCGEMENVEGVIGLEIHGTDGLLRSLAVTGEVRGTGCGSVLVKQLEKYAQSIGMKQLYLLTETAEDYFRRKGYTSISRESASNAIRHTKEFSQLCPENAVLMRKRIAS